MGRWYEWKKKGKKLGRESLRQCVKEAEAIYEEMRSAPLN